MRLNPFLLIGIIVGLPVAALADVPAPGAEGADEPTTIEVAQVVSPATVDGSAPGSDLEEAEEAGFTLPFTTSLSLDTFTTMGNILRHRDSECTGSTDELDNCNVSNSVGQSYTLGFTFNVPAPITLMAGFDTGYSKQLTRAGGVNNIYDQRWSDSSLWALAPGFYNIPYVDVNLTANLSATVPTSRFSHQQRLYTSLAGGVTAAHTWGNFTLSYRAGYGRNFHEYTGATIDVAQLGFAPVHRADEYVAQDLLTTGGYLTQHRLTNTVSWSYSWLDMFATVVSFTRADAWAYSELIEAIEEDPSLLPEDARVTRHRDLVAGTIMHSYMATPFLSITGILRTVQPPLSADNSRVRFPFWDTETGDLSNTSFFVNLTATY